LPYGHGGAASVNRKVIEAAFWGAVLGASFAVGLIGIPAFGVVILILLAVFAGIVRLRLLA
jgi:hypothetical protein